MMESKTKFQIKAEQREAEKRAKLANAKHEYIDAAKARFRCPVGNDQAKREAENRLNRARNLMLKAHSKEEAERLMLELSVQAHKVVAEEAGK